MLIKYKYHPIEAHRWTVNGSHPRDNSYLITPEDGDSFLSEGKVVRRFNLPWVEGTEACLFCESAMSRHGWVDQDEDGLMVCPGDWVANDKNMKYAVYPNDEFKSLFTEDTYNPLKSLDSLLSDGKTDLALKTRKTLEDLVDSGLLISNGELRCNKKALNDPYGLFAPCSRGKHETGPCAHHLVLCPRISNNKSCDCINLIG